MSTPVQQLPRPSAPVSGATAVTDPIVRDVLMEMESEVAAAQHPVAQHSARAVQPMPSYAPRYMPPPAPQGWWNAAYAQRAVVAALVAALLLHPAAGEVIGRRVAILDANQFYNLAVRAALLAVVLYVLMWKMNM